MSTEISFRSENPVADSVPGVIYDCVSEVRDQENEDMLKNLLGDPVAQRMARLCRPFHRMGFTPNLATVCGTILSVLAGLLVWKGHWTWAGMIVLVAGFFDMLDGALARNYRSSSRFGAFLDSTCDRYSDAALYFGLTFYYLRVQGSSLWPLICLLAFLGAFLTSYTRARAECLIPRCEVGVAERGDRIGLLLVGLFLRVMKPVILVLAILSTITVLQRIHYTYRVLKNER